MLAGSESRHSSTSARVFQLTIRIETRPGCITKSGPSSQRNLRRGSNSSRLQLLRRPRAGAERTGILDLCCPSTLDERLSSDAENWGTLRACSPLAPNRHASDQPLAMDLALYGRVLWRVPLARGHWSASGHPACDHVRSQDLESRTVVSEARSLAKLVHRAPHREGLPVGTHRLACECSPEQDRGGSRASPTCMPSLRIATRSECSCFARERRRPGS